MTPLVLGVLEVVAVAVAGAAEATDDGVVLGDIDDAVPVVAASAVRPAASVSAAFLTVPVVFEVVEDGEVAAEVGVVAEAAEPAEVPATGATVTSTKSWSV